MGSIELIGWICLVATGINRLIRYLTLLFILDQIVNAKLFKAQCFILRYLMGADFDLLPSHYDFFPFTCHSDTTLPPRPQIRYYPLYIRCPAAYYSHSILLNPHLHRLVSNSPSPPRIRIPKGRSSLSLPKPLSTSQSFGTRIPLACFSLAQSLAMFA